MTPESGSAESASDQVADYLRRELLNGRLQPGERLREEEIAGRLHCGRYTVRAAIKMLVDARLLQHERNRGAKVPDLTRARIDEVFGYRSALEIGGLRLAQQHHADLSAVKDAVGVLSRLPDDAEWHEVTEAHSLIHVEIVRASGNSRLIASHAGCQDELNLLLVALRPNFTVRRFADLHVALLDALLIGGDTALNALQKDLDNDGYGSMLAALRRVEPTG